MTRLAGEVGALTEADKAPFGGSKAILVRFNQAKEQLLSGKMAPENKVFLKQVVGLLEKRSLQKFSNLAKARAKQYSRANKNLDFNELYQTLNPYGAIEQEEKKQGVDSFGFK